MSASVFHAIATQFRARYLNPLQFPGSHRSVEDRVSDLENGHAGPANSRKARTPAAQPEDTSSHARVMTNQHLKNQAQNGADIQRIREDHSSNLDAWHAEHSGAASDLLHTFNARMTDIQAQTKPSGGAWDDFHAAFGTHASAPVRPASKTPPEPTPAPARTAQLGMFPKSQVSSPQQFGLAATEGPRPQRNAASPATRKPRVTQPGLFPKSAVSPKKSAPAQASVSDEAWHSMLNDSVAERRATKGK
jgi:hypothetical protein